MKACRPGARPFSFATRRISSRMCARLGMATARSPCCNPGRFGKDWRALYEVARWWEARVPGFCQAWRADQQEEVGVNQGCAHGQPEARAYGRLVCPVALSVKSKNRDARLRAGMRVSVCGRNSDTIRQKRPEKLCPISLSRSTARYLKRRSLPNYIQREFEEFLTCGCLAHEFSAGRV